MGLMDQFGEAAGGMMDGQAGQNSPLQAVTSLLGQNSSVGNWTALFKHSKRTDSAAWWRAKPAYHPMLRTPSSWLAPDLIDKVTRNGKIEAGGVDQLLKMLQEKMGAQLPSDRQEDAPVPRRSAEDNQFAPAERAEA